MKALVVNTLGGGLEDRRHRYSGKTTRGGATIWRYGCDRLDAHEPGRDRSRASPSGRRSRVRLRRAEGSCRTGARHARRRRRTLLVGVARPDVEIGINIVSAIGGQKRVQGVNLGSTSAKRDIPAYADLYLQGRMNLDDLVSRTISLRDVNDGYESLKGGSLNRVVVTSF